VDQAITTVATVVEYNHVTATESGEQVRKRAIHFQRGMHAEKAGVDAIVDSTTERKSAK